MMVLIYVLGIGLIGSGLFLLCHHGYTHMSLSDVKNNLGTEEEQEPEHVTIGEKKEPKSVNDCCVPMCFFQSSQIYNHETWIVVCLLCGSTILLMSLAVYT
jgi:hypothetical protein